MKIKLKLSLGIGLLFVMITLMTVLSILFINRLATDTDNILVDNYNSIDYGRQMMISLNKRLLNQEDQIGFKKNLI
ncbi:MAG: PAS domain-containing sensor histidine kinase, partial [Ginsengibacter sp.]